MSATTRQFIFRSRLLVASTYMLVSSAVVFAQSGRADNQFRPRRPPGSTSESRETADTLDNEFASLRAQAPAADAQRVPSAEMLRLARQIAVSGRLGSDRLREVLAQFKPQERLIGISLERLSLPAQELTYHECHAAADLYGSLFRLVHDDRKVPFGCRAVECLKQYIRLASVREVVLRRLKAEGIPDHGNRTVRFTPADEEGLEVFEYHKGFHCVHLWFSGGHRYTSFVLDRDGTLNHVTLDLAGRIVEDANGQPDTTDRAVRFLREVLRVLPYESKVVYSVRDIPPPAFERWSEQDATREKGKWEEFVKGVGQTITGPTRVDVDGSAEYSVFVYHRLGGQVIRYRVCCSRVRHVQIRQNIVARWAGDCWGIM